MVVVQWDINVQCGEHTHSGVYANNMKYMYIHDSGHTVDCRKFI